MDFSFLFIVILMVMAVQSNNTVITLALFALLLITSAKNKFLLVAALVGGALAFVWNMPLEASIKTPLLLGGLFVVLILLVKKDSDSPAPPVGYGGYY
ncbi:MAG: hypothetical protein V1787_04210 [Candidatus Micrarchaeota archaeon]